MKKIFAVLPILLLSEACIQCDPCAPIEDTFQLSYQSSSGDDLYFGPKKSYSIDSLVATYRYSGERLSVYQYIDTLSPMDTVIFFNDPRGEEIIVYRAVNKIDTLFQEYLFNTKGGGRCCKEGSREYSGIKKNNDSMEEDYGLHPARYFIAVD